MDNFTRKRKMVILIIAVLIMFTVGSKMLLNGNKDEIEIEESGLFLDDSKEEDFDIKPEDNESLHADEEELPSHVVVHITGEIAKPGVVTLENGGRVIDAIKKAGGLLSSADQDKINLAQKLFDEDKISIPRIGDDLLTDGENIDSNEESLGTTVVSGAGSEGHNERSSNSASGGVNINVASKEELKTLPGIGDVTAEKIIDHRETTKFSSIEDIKNVSGIGEKKFEAIQSMITIK